MEHVIGKVTEMFRNASYLARAEYISMVGESTFKMFSAGSTSEQQPCLKIVLVCHFSYLLVLLFGYE